MSDPSQIPPASPDGSGSAPRYGERAPEGASQPQYGERLPDAQQPADPFVAPAAGTAPPAYSSYQAPSGPPAYSSYQAPMYPVGQVPSAPTGPVPRPPLIVVAFWAWVAAAVVSIGAALLYMSLIPTLIANANLEDTMVSMLGSDYFTTAGVTPDQMVSMTESVMRNLCVIAIVMSIVIVAIATQVLRGKNWARILLAVLGVLGIFGMFPLAPYGWLSILLLIAAIVIQFLPACNKYVAAAGGRR